MRQMLQALVATKENECSVFSCRGDRFRKGMSIAGNSCK